MGWCGAAIFTAHPLERFSLQAAVGMREEGKLCPSPNLPDRTMLYHFC